ncbi:MAG TPA: permease-like cell division protein FtsX [Actinomycetota bacterium]|nr:permease-like cell division protein FtsX [Actinomycetota bacterium]
MAFKVGYFVRESAVNLRRNLLMTLAATLTAAVSLLLLGGVLTLGSFVRGITGEIERQVEVAVFLKDEVSQQQQDSLLRSLQELPVVSDVRYESKEEAFELFKKLYRDQPTIWQNVDPDVLPASFRVAMKDPERVDIIRSAVGENPAVDQVVDQRETVERLLGFTNLLRTFSTVMVIILLVAAVLLISNTIQLGIFARRKEIEIMKLVGATNWFVRIPFMFEGVAVGIAGTVLAMLLLSVAKSFILKWLPPFIPTAALRGVDVVQMFWLLVLGSVIGALGSSVALRKYLNV